MENWEIVLSAAFASIGVIEYIKGFFPGVNKNVWRGLMPLFCLGFAAVTALLPGILALSMTQVGYDLIVDTVKNKLSKVGK